MDVSKIRCYADNVLVCFEAHAMRQEPEKMVNGLYHPKVALESKAGEAILATVIAAGPGFYKDPWVNHEVGTHPYKVGPFIPMDEGIKPGATVLLEGAANAGDRIYGDGHMEYRMIRASCIAGVIEDE